MSAIKTAAPKNVTKVAKATGATKPQADVVEDESGMFDEVLKRYQEAQDAMLKFFKAPSWKRTLCACVTSVLVGCGLGWVAGEVLSWLVVGAVALAVPTFIMLIVYALGLGLAAWYGSKLCARIGGAILTGEADERAIAAYDAVKAKLAALNPFGKRTIAPAAA